MPETARYTPAQAPEGYMIDAQGRMVPEANVRPADKLEDELVRDIVLKGARIAETLAAFKGWAMEEAAALRETVAANYDATLGGRKGNMTLRSYDGRAEVQIAVSETLSFGPELQAAKALVDECVMAWSEGANAHLRALVLDAFQVNKQGRIDTHRVLGLRRLDIDDPTWLRAMEAISDALRVIGSTTYLRLYVRDPKTGQRTPIALDIAKL